MIDSAIVLSVFMIAVMICMLCSAAFHLFLCHSERWYSTLLRADLTGVSIQIFGSFVPGLYFGFACEPVWRAVYLSLVALIFVGGTVAPCIPAFHAKSFKWGRVAVYATMASFGSSIFFVARTLLTSARSALVPFIHWLVARAGPDPRQHRTIWLFFVMFALYGLGVGFYLSRFPGSSHRSHVTRVSRGYCRTIASRPIRYLGMFFSQRFFCRISFSTDAQPSVVASLRFGSTHRLLFHQPGAASNATDRRFLLNNNSQYNVFRAWNAVTPIRTKQCTKCQAT
jgi:predicted membrane channel-forming protein YqfA (hemolysin III family)